MVVSLCTQLEKMKTIIIKPVTIIDCKNFAVSIGRESHQVGIYSRITGNWMELKQVKVSKKLRTIKRKFKACLCSSEQFFFEHMTEPQTLELINILKS